MGHERKRKRRRSATERVPVPRHTRTLYFALVSVVTIVLAVSWGLAHDDSPIKYSFKVVARYPHDSNAFCQGLVFHKGVLYESTGHYGESTVRCVDLKTGAVKRHVQLSNEFFGEGLAVAENQLIQLTWKAGIAFKYDLATFLPSGSFRYRNEGWGLTHDGEHFVMSDGSDQLRFLDPDSFKVVRTIRVTDRGKRVDLLNELEFVKGEIFANVWYSDSIARISPKTGIVTSWIDLRGLLKSRRDKESVLNGIAYDSVGDRLFVTGKNWPALYEIELIKR